MFDAVDRVILELQMSLREMLIFCCERVGLGYFTRNEKCIKQMEALGVGVSLCYALIMVDLVVRTRI